MKFDIWDHYFLRTITKTKTKQNKTKQIDMLLSVSRVVHLDKGMICFLLGLL